MASSKPIVFVLVVAAGLAGCATTPTKTAAPAPPPAAPAVAVAGASQDCVSLQNIREARVIDDRTIDFILRDGKTLRNTLPYACPSLGFEKAFSYATSLSQLCSVDTIRVIQQGGGPRVGASCGLGRFTPLPPPVAGK